MTKKYEIDQETAAEIIATARTHGNYLRIELPGGPVQEGWAGMLTSFTAILAQTGALDLLLARFGLWRTSGVVAVIDGGLALPLACAGDLYSTNNFDHAEFGKFIVSVERQARQVAERHRGLQAKDQASIRATYSANSLACWIDKTLHQLAAVNWDGGNGKVLLPHDVGTLAPLSMPPLENVQVTSAAMETKDCRGKVAAISLEMGLVLLTTGVRLAPTQADKLVGIKVGDEIQCATQRQSRSFPYAQACTVLKLLQPELDNFPEASVKLSGGACRNFCV
jgi:hypothetical protein